MTRYAHFGTGTGDEHMRPFIDDGVPEGERLPGLRESHCCELCLHCRPKAATRYCFALPDRAEPGSHSRTWVVQPTDTCDLFQRHED